VLRNVRLRLHTLTLLVILSGLVVLTAALGAAAYRHVYGRIQSGFDEKLIAASTVTAAFIDGDEHSQLMKANSERDPLYLKYVGPMQRIMREKDFTYIYTQIPTGGTTIIYGLDGTVGTDHSPIGSPDEAPEDEAKGIMDVYVTGTTYLSGIHLWQLWGLLKSAFVPITSRAGAITAMAGTDVNITVIRQKTRFALLDVVECGVALLALAGIVTARVVKRVTGPIGQLKAVALKVAAGGYGQQVEIDSPSELRALAGSFNRLSISLEQRLHDLRQINEAVETQRRERLLYETLRSRNLFGEAPATDSLRLSYVPDAHSNCDASGWVRWHNQILLWAGRDQESPLAAARRRHDFASVLQPLLHRLSGNWPALARALEPLYPRDIACFLLIDVEGDRALSIPREGLAPTPRQSGTPLPTDGTVTIPSGAVLEWNSRSGSDPSHSLRLSWSAGGADHPVEGLRRLLRETGLLAADFSEIAPDDMDTLLNVAHLERREPDEHLTVQGETNDRLFLIIEGQAQLEVTGGTITLSVGHWVGEFSFLFGGVANNSVTAVTQLHCLVWDRTPLAATLTECPSLESSFLAMLARNIATKKLSPRHTVL
jgi:HAMP domain-containing protein